MSTENPHFSNPEFGGLDPESIAFLNDLDSQAEQQMARADRAVDAAEQTILGAFGEEGALPLEKQTYSGDDTTLRLLAGEFHDELRQAPDGVIPPVGSTGGFSQANRDAMQEHLRWSGYTDENGTWHRLI